MNAWQPLSDVEDAAVWNRFEEQFHFNPFKIPKVWPAIVEPAPSITYTFSNFFPSGDVAQNISLAEDLNKKSLAAFRQCVSVEERIYALDWQHQGYWFFPHNPSADNVNDWPFPVIPDGDYYMFIAEDFRFGSFGHPWEKTICVFGQRLLDAYRSSSNPFLFAEIIRKNGRPYGA